MSAERRSAYLLDDPDGAAAATLSFLGVEVGHR